MNFAQYQRLGVRSNVLNIVKAAGECDPCDGKARQPRPFKLRCIQAKVYYFGLARGKLADEAFMASK